MFFQSFLLILLDPNSPSGIVSCSIKICWVSWWELLIRLWGCVGFCFLDHFFGQWVFCLLALGCGETKLECLTDDKESVKWFIHGFAVSSPALHCWWPLCVFFLVFFFLFSSFGEPVDALQTYVFRSYFSFLVCKNPSGSEKSFVGCQHLLISMGTFGDNTAIVSWIRLLKVDLHMQKSVSQGLWCNSERSQPTATSNCKHWPRLKPKSWDAVLKWMSLDPSPADGFRLKTNIPIQGFAIVS